MALHSAMCGAQAQDMSRSWRIDASRGHSIHGSIQLQRGFGLKQVVLMRMTVSVQDAAGGHGTAEDSPQIVGNGLSRETSAASADLGSIADTEAEIRRIAEVISVACRASGLIVQHMVPSSTHYGEVSSQVLGQLMRYSGVFEHAGTSKTHSLQIHNC